MTKPELKTVTIRFYDWGEISAYLIEKYGKSHPGLQNDLFIFDLKILSEITEPGPTSVRLRNDVVINDPFAEYIVDLLRKEFSETDLPIW